MKHYCVILFLIVQHYKVNCANTKYYCVLLTFKCVFKVSLCVKH